MDKKDAEIIAFQYVEVRQKEANCELNIIHELTQEEQFGWVFYYDSKKFIDTEDPKFAVGGNAPIIIDKQTGKIEITGTAHPVEHYIGIYKLHGTCHLDER